MLKMIRFTLLEIWRKKIFLLKLSVFVFLIWYTFALPKKLFNDPFSTVVESYEGELMAAHIAPDGQWRFPENDTVPEKLKTCIIAFEDKNFYYHLGVSPAGIVRAIKQNFSNGKIVSGGSTITMQLVRMMRKNPPRKYSEKIYEMILATRVEIQYSKDEILALYASHAPFGNNVVGMDAASWRYFGRKANQLSWAESATLAVLPNAPGLIYPGKNHDALLAKRNRLLKTLFKEGKIDQLNYALAIAEPIPPAPLPLPRLAPHLMQNLLVKGQKGQCFRSTLRFHQQEMVDRILNQHALNLRDNRIMNGAAIVTEIETGEIVAYVGNTNVIDAEYSGDVNCIDATRSSGSILKPFLYGGAIQDGIITPNMLLSDLPSKFGSFSPNNFSGQFEGAIPANKALSRSLNIPMVHLLKQYGMSKFHHNLKNLGFTSLTYPSDHYGLSIILGGAEVKMWDVNKVYVAMAQKLRTNQVKGVTLSKQVELRPKVNFPLSQTSIYSTFEALIEVNRPDEDNNWRAFESSQKIAWKTGTSFGFRDAWAVGVSGKYCVTIWVGNADGEGRPGLTGVRAAAPILFDIFRQLPNGNWYNEPSNGFQNMKLCSESGHKAGKNCPNPTWKKLPRSCATSASCAYHKIIHLDQQGQYRVTNKCEETYNMKHVSWFVLPPMMESFYKANHPEYSALPPFAPACLSNISDNSIGLLYPKHGSRIVLPKEMAGNRGSTVFEASHRQKDMLLFWHIDNEFLGSTVGIHQMTVQPEPGKHVLTLVDEIGVSVHEKFEVIR
jgi:penicillin-binding protein 1C